MLIALEGVDGSGKSTLCAVLAERLTAIAYATPPKKYLQLREKVDKNASTEDHYRFYLKGVHDASDEINEMLKDGNKVVSDRYWLTTYTYHQIMGASVSIDHFKSIVKPTLTVILSLNHEVQIERMLSRGMSVGDRRTLNKQREISAAFYKNVLELNVPFVVVDTQCFSSEKCADIIVSALKKQKSG